MRLRLLAPLVEPAFEGDLITRLHGGVFLLSCTNRLPEVDATTAAAAGRMVLSVMAYVDEYEGCPIVECTREALTAAQARLASSWASSTNAQTRWTGRYGPAPDLCPPGARGGQQSRPEVGTGCGLTRVLGGFMVQP